MVGLDIGCALCPDARERLDLISSDIPKAEVARRYGVDRMELRWGVPPENRGVG